MLFFMVIFVAMFVAFFVATSTYMIFLAKECFSMGEKALGYLCILAALFVIGTPITMASVLIFG